MSGWKGSFLAMTEISVERSELVANVWDMLFVLEEVDIACIVLWAEVVGVWMAIDGMSCLSKSY